jgi:CPA1 family monovalent cation:H+ antiporter
MVSANGKAGGVHDAAFVLGLVVAIAVLASAALSRLVEVPYPVFLVLTGLVASFVPGTPTFHLAPEVVFYVFLPPLLYYAAFLSSPRALRANWLPIGLLAVGLVLATTVITAFVADVVVAGLSLGAAFVLGAIVAPTDPVAATAVFKRLGVPRRLTVVLEGESLVNDGVALVLYGLAVSASITGSFSLAHGVLRFGEVVAGGIAWGLVVGYAIAQARTRVHDAGIEITLSLFTPFVAYIPADRSHVSGVLAAVTAGLFLGTRSEGLFRPGVRLQARAFWDQLNFLLNSVLFVLLGLQFRDAVAAQHGRSVGRLVVEAAIVSAVVIGRRVGWQFVVPPKVWTIGHDEETAPATWRERLLLGWGGMRGAISLAAALAVPITVQQSDGGSDRATIIYLTFAVIFATLVIEGVTLPIVVRALGLTGAGAGGPHEREAKLAMVEAALKRADEIEEAERVEPDIVAAVRERFEQERRFVEHEVAAAGGDEEERHRGRREDYDWLRRELVQAQRDELNRRYRCGALNASEARRLRRDLDLRDSLIG